jgi:tetratricopeptide (TPR) repeat protein/transglutaminase-like putative cysteine protease
MLPALCRLGFLPLLVGVLPFVVAAQSTVVSVQSPPPDAASFAKEPAIIEDFDVRARFENDGRQAYDIAVRIKVQSESGRHDNGLLVFPYSSANESLEIRYARVRKPDGVVVDTPLDSVQDLTSEIARNAPFYTDLHEKHVAVKGLSVGDTVEYATSSKLTKPYAEGQFWSAFNFSRGIALHEQFLVDVPKARPVKFLSPGFTPEVVDLGDRRIYKFSRAHLHKDDEKKFNTGDAPPADIQLTSFASWNEVAVWYNSLQKSSLQITPELRAKALDLTRGKTSDQEKIEAIYEYVSLKFRYIGIALGQGRFTPHAASEVLANQFGDCKDKHTLLAALLQAAGIQSYAALISSNLKIQKDFPTPGLFDHVITAVPQENSILWLDTTPEIAPLAVLQLPLRDKLALVVHNDGSADLQTTSSATPFPFYQRFSMDGELSADGVFDAKARMEVRGDFELVLRQAFRNTPEVNWKELAQRISALMGFGGEVNDVTAASPDDITHPFWYAYSYHRPDYGDWSNHRITLPMPVMALPGPPKDDAKDPGDIFLGALQLLDYEATVKLPSGFWLSAPAAVEEKRDFAAYTSAASFEGGVLRGERHLKVLQSKVSEQDLPNYAAFHKVVAEDYGTWIVLAEGLKPQPQIYQPTRSKNPDAQRLFDEARQSLMLGAPFSASKSLEQAVKLDPGWADAWLLLGAARMNSDFDSAMTAMKKGIALQPSDRRGRQMLAAALYQHHRRKEAIQAFRDFLKLQPDDAYALGALAGLLMDAQNYADAVPLLEKVSANRPSDAYARVQLGTAYLHLGDDERASAQFQKAMEIEPDDTTLNNVAWALAEAGKRLPEALAYALRAVRGTETRSADTSSLAAEQMRLGTMNDLVAHWDTLGWVCFKMNDLPTAQKYLSAAWSLSLDPLIGEHLVEVYDKLGRQDRATEMASLVLAAIPANGDPVLRDKLLARVSKGRTKPTQFFDSTKALERLREFHLGPVTGKQGTATFEITLDKGSVIKDVRFVRGDDSFESFIPAIKALKFNAEFPDDGPTNIVRRGDVNCSKGLGDCRLQLFSVSAAALPALKGPPPAAPQPPGS